MGLKRTFNGQAFNEGRQMLGTLETKAAPADTDRERLRQLIETLSLRVGEEFTLSSGRKSNVFFNLKQTMLHPEGAALLAEAILRILEARKVHNVGGLEMGAVPLVSALCLKSHGRYALNTFFVRKQVKDHGARQGLDGHIEDGAEAIILDDVVTTGGSVMQAVEAARARGCEVKTVVAIVDREEGGAEALAKEGLELVSLYTRRDFNIE